MSGHKQAPYLRLICTTPDEVGEQASKGVKDHGSEGGSE